MSEFQRDLFKRRILEHEARIGPAGPGLLVEEDGDDEDRDTVSPLGAASLPTGMGPPRSLNSKRRDAEITPIPWSNYFQEKYTFDEQRGDDVISFNAYYSAPSDDEAPIFIFHHGAGSSGLSFAVVCATLRKRMLHSAEESASSDKEDQKVAGVLALDMRGHGETVVKGPGSNDYSLQTLTQDLIDIYKYSFEHFGWSDKQQIVLVGHSLGGAIVTNASLSKQLKHLLGVVVIDAVEELAIDALKSMHMILDRFPPSFLNIDSAIKWHLKNMTLRNKESAAVSIPAKMKPVKDDGSQQVTWITDLRSTEAYWGEWFTGLSENFLKAPAARLLILAGNDKLDKPLIIGQMQGKYQLVVFADSGHFVQEDVPDKTAITLIDFWERNGKPVSIIPVYGKFRTPEY